MVGKTASPGRGCVNHVANVPPISLFCFFRKNMTKGNVITGARMNFLYQSADVLLSKKSSKSQQALAQHYTKLMVDISRKSVQRLSKNLKRTICKKCRTLLKPGLNAKFVNKKAGRRKGSQKFGTLCLTCDTEKLFPKTKKADKPKKQ